MECSKYITDAVRPNHLLFNHAYTDNNKNANSYSIGDQLEQDMDESDTPSPQLQHTPTSRVFCCGEVPLRGSKVLRSGPGQAVQVITMQADEKEEVGTLNRCIHCISYIDGTQSFAFKLMFISF